MSNRLREAHASGVGYLHRAALLSVAHLVPNLVGSNWLSPGAGLEG
jgi:hypothetical protein